MHAGLAGYQRRILRDRFGAILLNMLRGMSRPDMLLQLTCSAGYAMRCSARSCTRNTMLRRAIGRLGWLAAGLLCAKLLLSLAIQLWPIPTPPWARWLLHTRWRRHYRAPRRTLALLGIQPGMRVLELGPGSGLFTLEAARLAGDQGQLVCVDLQMAMLRPLKQATQAAGLKNVFMQAATAEQLPLGASSFDLVLAIAVLPMVEHKHRALQELRRVLKPSGLLAVSEEIAEPEYVPAVVTRRWCRRAGFVLVGRMRTLWWYMLLFRQPAPGDEA